MSIEVHQVAETVTTSNELDVLFSLLFDEYFNGENQVVLKSSAVTTTDASNKRQQQPDSTSSTSTLATSITANGNFDLSYALSWKPCQEDSLNLPDHRAQVDQGSQIKMIQVKEMMQDNDLKNSKSKDKGSKSRSQSMDEQSHYKQDKTITRQSINVKRHIFNVIGGTEEFEERDLNIGGDYDDDDYEVCEEIINDDDDNYEFCEEISNEEDSYIVISNDEMDNDFDYRKQRILIDRRTIFRFPCMVFMEKCDGTITISDGYDFVTYQLPKACLKLKTLSNAQ
ncbi:hypothetical protein Tco_0769090 [Tanacetum coccineum]|uniref:Uncharacterized protein n=1 Tax=Tanacetum coccineum TaxID=301880 RepID=A0ABQ4Z8F6_9ASTR